MTDHTPTPWHSDETAIFAQDGVLARIPNHPENGVNWQADAAFIVKAVNGHEALVEALTLAEDILSRAPFSNALWPNGMHPMTGITQIRDALALVGSPKHE